MTPRHHHGHVERVSVCPLEQLQRATVRFRDNDALCKYLEKNWKQKERKLGIEKEVFTSGIRVDTRGVTAFVTHEKAQNNVSSSIQAANGHCHFY